MYNPLLYEDILEDNLTIQENLEINSDYGLDCIYLGVKHYISFIMVSSQPMLVQGFR